MLKQRATESLRTSYKDNTYTTKIKTMNLQILLLINLLFIFVIQAQDYKKISEIEKSLRLQHQGQYFSSTQELNHIKAISIKSWTITNKDNIHELKNTLDLYNNDLKMVKLNDNFPFLKEIKNIKQELKLLEEELSKADASVSKSKVYLESFIHSLQRLDLKLAKKITENLNNDREEFADDELRKIAKEDHDKLLKDAEFTSAQNCRKCHPVHFDQWAMSQHAYAQLSPIYMSMQKAVNHLTNKTNGDFCIRCHTQVGMIKGESIYDSNLDRHPMSREGVSCIVCHRVSPGEKNESSLEYGKVSARLSIQKSDLKGKVYGPKATEDVKKEIEESGYKKIHKNVGRFDRMWKAGFCSSCHDAILGNGLRLEEAFSEYQNSQASKDNITCQDCHMSQIPGKAILDINGKVAPENYAFGRISKPSTRDRKMTDHTFSGPDFTVIHPALFPHSYTISKMANMREWLGFKYAEGWGSKRWEDSIGKEQEGLLHKNFWPTDNKTHRWMYRRDREKARELILGQFDKLKEARRRRLQLLRKGYLFKKNEKREIISINQANIDGLNFEASMKNGINAHNVPTDLVTERLIWFHVTVHKEGIEKPIFESGDLDPNGDLRDIHSTFVHNNDSRLQIADGIGAQRLLFSPEFPILNDQKVTVDLDNQLFSLQSKFITKNIRGGEREQIIGVNHSVDTLPFIRPSTNSAILKGQPGDVRIHRMSLPPKTSRTGKYQIDQNLLQGPGRYKIKIELKSAIVPVNLINAISIVGFDYYMKPKQVASKVVFGFEKELNSMRYYSISNAERLQEIITDNKYLNKAHKKYEHVLKVLTEKNARTLIDHATVRFYAEDVATKKIKHIKERMAEISNYKSWLETEAYKDLNKRLLNNPLDELPEFKTFVSEKYFSKTSEKDKKIIRNIIGIIIPCIKIKILSSPVIYSVYSLVLI